ncbi:MAG: hypothetical protein OXE55_05300 [Flavobacteriaceae bacterium]|nr:hypothetical protein [Flavobacteriaceae bacterium]
MAKKRGMSSEHASSVKISGHQNEHDFAQLIGGHVNPSDHQDKRDVIDSQLEPHSVKGGSYWQIFLYSRNRIVNNTMFKGIGNIKKIMLRCIDSYPDNFEDYQNDKLASKIRLQEPMRFLREELSNENILCAFLDKGLFDGGNAKYLSIFLGETKAHINDKVFHVFHKNDVINSLIKNISVNNSKAKNKNQTDDQKVVFFSNLVGKNGKNIGEIEDRHDSAQHYREIKFRLHAEPTYSILNQSIETRKRLCRQLVIYGKAGKTFKPNIKS